MVLGLISAIAACPAIVGTTEAVRHGQRANARERHRGEKCNLVVELPVKNAYCGTFDGALVVLKDGKVGRVGKRRPVFKADWLHSCTFNTLSPASVRYTPLPATTCRTPTTRRNGRRPVGRARDLCQPSTGTTTSTGSMFTARRKRYDMVSNLSP